MGKQYSIATLKMNTTSSYNAMENQTKFVQCYIEPEIDPYTYIILSSL